MRLRRALLGLPLLLVLAPARGADAVIDLRFVVDAGAAPDAAARTKLRERLTGHVTTLNGYFRDSRVALRARLAAVDFTPVAERDAARLLDAMSREAPPFAGLFRRTAAVGADYTFALVKGLTVRGHGRCGRALKIPRSEAELASPRSALAVLDVACGPHSLAHELGHLMGLNHGAAVDACQPGRGHDHAAAPYANGYAVGNCDGEPQPGEFGTIMVGGWMRTIHGDQHASLPLFSNAALHDPRCGSDGRCGDPATGDAARFLNAHAALYAGHRSPR
ncbi:hypothetical protein JCM17961_41970 [Endothiovibrio diazotrophicus]